MPENDKNQWTLVVNQLKNLATEPKRTMRTISLGIVRTYEEIKVKRITDKLINARANLTENDQTHSSSAESSTTTHFKK